VRAVPLQLKEIEMEPIGTSLDLFLRDEQAVTAIEYGLIAALIAVGTNLSSVFSYIAAELG
jgi:pilus assembly protein Flp/PilA